jgi:hypothetical protein
MANQVSVSGHIRNFIFHQLQGGSRAHPVSYPVVTGVRQSEKTPSHPTKLQVLVTGSVLEWLTDDVDALK